MVVGLGTWVLPYHGAMAQVQPLRTLSSEAPVRLAGTDATPPTSLGIALNQPNEGQAKLPVIRSDDEDHALLTCQCDLSQLPTVSQSSDRLLGNSATNGALDQDNSESESEEEAESPQTVPGYDGDQTASDDELGILRVRSQPVGIDGELGVLRVRPTEDAPLEVEPEPTRQTTVFLTGRSNVYGGNNLFRTPNPIDDRIYQAGLGFFAFPELTSTTNLILSAEANIARYEELSVVDYNEVQLQAGIRQRLGRRSYGQLNWRYQNLSTPGRDSFFSANYVELLLSRRDILNNRTWLDAYYQARLSFSDPAEFSRFSQIATGSINYGFDPKTRASLLYQLFLDDYTQTSRNDIYHQVLAQVSHDLSDTTRISLFTGVRFGDSSRSNVDFEDTIYGASVNINVPLF
ncbi:MAG: hypothetical protein AAFY17_11825 [Cyanobacteria bacterium J06642_11]